MKVHNEQTANFWIEKLKVDLLPITKEISIGASQFKFEHKEKNFSYPDCIGYLSALKNQMLFLTGDREFKGMNNAEFAKSKKRCTTTA